MNLISAEEFGGTIEAFTYPDEFGQNDGSDEPAAGVRSGSRDVVPSAWSTARSWATTPRARSTATSCTSSTARRPHRRSVPTRRSTTHPRRQRSHGSSTTTPVPVADRKPTSVLTVDSTKSDPDILQDLEDILFGTDSDDARLPSPDEVIAIFEGGMVDVDLTLAAPTSRRSSRAPASSPSRPSPASSGRSAMQDAAPGAQPALAERGPRRRSGPRRSPATTWSATRPGRSRTRSSRRSDVHAVVTPR